MKRILAMLVVWLVPAILLAQTTKTIEVRFSEEEFVFEQIGEGYEILSPVHYLSVHSDSLKPALPYVYINILLDSDKIFSSYSVSLSDSLLHTNILLNAGHFERHTTQMSNPPINNVTYPLETYPNNIVEYVGSYSLGGYRYASFAVSPFKYEADTRNIYINKIVNITIDQSSIQSISQGISSFRNAIRHMVVNSNEVDSLYTIIDNSGEYEYLIITCDSLSSVFQQLADWKTTKGVKTKVISVENIYAAYEDSTQQLKIKHAIKDLYEGQGYSLKYVLLGGKVDIVPTQMCHIQVGTENNIKDVDETPSDWFYGSLSSLNWDTNGNNHAGEIEDSIDISADIIVSRISVKNIHDDENIINRIILYEKAPIINNYGDKILMCGKAVMTNNIGSTNQSDAQYLGTRLWDEGIAPYWNGEVIRLYDTGTDFEGDANYDFTREHLQAEFSKGYFLVNVFTHGDMYGYSTEGSGGGYFITDAASQANGSNTILVTQSCYANTFDLGASMGEAFMNNPNSGIIAYLGGSRTVKCIPSFNIFKEFYISLFDSGSPAIGRALFNAKNSRVGACQRYIDGERWNFLTLNLLGDPEMPVFLSTPQNFDNVTFSFAGNKLTVNTGLADCKICVMSSEDMGESYYELRDSVSSSSFHGMPNECTVCITKTGYVPYVFYFNKRYYLQNVAIAEDMTINAGHVYAGSDVTTEKEEGPVSIESGKTIITASNMTIKNDFEVKLGAELEINVGN